MGSHTCKLRLLHPLRRFFVRASNDIKLSQIYRQRRLNFTSQALRAEDPPSIQQEKLATDIPDPNSRQNIVCLAQSVVSHKPYLIHFLLL